MNLFVEKWKQLRPYGADCQVSSESMDMDLICKADETFHTAWNIANSSDWKEERRKDNGDIVESKILHGGSRKSFKVTALINAPAKVLFEEHVQGLEKKTDWMTMMSDSRVLKFLGDDVTITYQVTDHSGGIISPRDIVVLGKKGKIGNDFVISGASHHYEAMLNQKGLVRAHKHPSCIIIRPVSEQQSLFQWFLDIDMKVWIPQVIHDTIWCHTMLNHVASVRNHEQQLRLQGKW